LEEREKPQQTGGSLQHAGDSIADRFCPQ
jgi:hypothetical protein